MDYPLCRRRGKRGPASRLGQLREDVETDVLRAIFMQRVSDLQAANPTQKPIERPRDFDWVRSEWQRRVTTQKVWQNWWKQNGYPKTP